jgi:hypothetical protein
MSTHGFAISESRLSAKPTASTAVSSRAVQLNVFSHRELNVDLPSGTTRSMYGEVISLPSRRRAALKAFSDS